VAMSVNVRWLASTLGVDTRTARAALAAAQLTYRELIALGLRSRGASLYEIAEDDAIGDEHSASRLVNDALDKIRGCGGRE